jgi:hypothetical protein
MRGIANPESPTWRIAAIVALTRPGRTGVDICEVNQSRPRADNTPAMAALAHPVTALALERAPRRCEADGISFR